MEKYIIYKEEGTSNKEYVGTIYRNSVSTDSDIGDALELPTKSLALDLCDFLNKRGNVKYKVMCIKTTIEEVVE